MQRVVILGGGPSGLGVAWGLTSNGHTNLLVVEKKAQLGGLSGSFTEGETRFDYGPHRFSPEFPELVSALENLMGGELQCLPNQQGIYLGNRFYRYPLKGLDLLNLPTLKWGLKALLKRKNNSTSPFRKRIQKIYGSLVAQNIFFPMCEKVWGNVDAMDPSFAEIRFSLRSKRDTTFYYPQQGFQQIWDRLGNHLVQKGVEIRCSSTVESIHLTGNRVTSVRINREKIPCDTLVSTIPTQSLAALLNLSIQRKSFQERGMLLAGFLLQQPTTLPARVIIFPEKDFIFNRLSEQNQFSRKMVPEGHSAITADILTEVGSPTWQKPDTEILNQIETDLLHLPWFKKELITQRYLWRMPVAYPLPTVEREEAQTQWNQQIQRFENILCTGRFATSDYNNSHTALHKGMELGKWIASHAFLGAPLSGWYEKAEALRKIPIRD